jgi:protein involved in polysaccharide export with SLBB domain
LALTPDSFRSKRKSRVFPGARRASKGACRLAISTIQGRPVRNIALAVSLVLIAPALAQEPAGRPASHAYRIEPPDIIRVSFLAPGQPEFSALLLVRPDGTVGLRTHGVALVAGSTTAEAAGQIRKTLAGEFECPAESITVHVAVARYRTPHAWVIKDVAGQPEKVCARKLSGDETVLDLIASVPGLPRVARKCDIWIERRTEPRALRVDWVAITQHGNTATNYGIRSGDLIHVETGDLWSLFR